MHVGKLKWNYQRRMSFKVNILQMLHWSIDSERFIRACYLHTQYSDTLVWYLYHETTIFNFDNTFSSVYIISQIMGIRSFVFAVIFAIVIESRAVWHLRERYLFLGPHLNSATNGMHGTIAVIASVSIKYNLFLVLVCRAHVRVWHVSSHCHFLDEIKLIRPRG